MNREQALEILKEMAFTAYGHRFEALDTAINALSADVRENRTSEDCISREMAINECYTIDVDGERFKVIQYETLLGLPSVQPKKEDNTMDIYSDLLRVKHGTMSIDSLIDKVWCRERR